MLGGRGALLEVTIGTECPPDPGANCAPPMTGRIVGERLILGPTFSRAPWTFERVGS